MAPTFEIKALLLDIEGTTTSISFVFDKLFPYISEHLESFVTRKWESDICQNCVRALAKQSEIDASNSVDGLVQINLENDKEKLVQSVIENVRWQMSKNSKSYALKLLQGYICEEGCQSGEITGHVYDDVKPNLENWKNSEKNIYIYSSGSVHAQKLIFGHSCDGDLKKYIDGHFDTEVGPKTNKDSYIKISENIGFAPKDILFLTDILAEATAAFQSGYQVCLVSRPGNAPLSPDTTQLYDVINSFSELVIV